MDLQADDGGAQLNQKRLMLAALSRERKMFTSPPRTIESLPRHRRLTKGAATLRPRIARPKDESHRSAIHKHHVQGAQEYGTHGRDINNTHLLGNQTCADAMGYQGICESRRNSAVRPPRGSVRRPHREE